MDELLKIDENCIVVDWLSVSCNTSGIGFHHLVRCLGMENLNWIHKEGSYRSYAKRAEWGKITIHYTPQDYEDIQDTNYNIGCLLDMSGQGCREYESFGRGDWALLITGFRELRQAGIDVRFTRLDIAYDDFRGFLPIEHISLQAQRLEFTGLAKRSSVTYSADKHDIEHIGQCVIHGSRSSNTLLRIYNKRVERQRYDIPHWVRCEVQMRKESAERFLDLACSGGYTGLGDLFYGVVYNLIQYRIPNPGESNKSRWALAPWFTDWCTDVKKISLWSTKDVEYNKSRMDEYAYTQNHNHTIAEIMMDGLPEYLRSLYCAAIQHNQGEELPDKYKAVIFTTPTDGAKEFAAAGCRLPTFAEWLLSLRDQIDEELQIYDIPENPPV